ncbi:MAG: PQQ-dependent sugar dehydrogenase [Bacteroidia bacterium]|nr:PQQ-dependent sugar dehydrogenase [Bacteroidia bacterium]
MRTRFSHVLLTLLLLVATGMAAWAQPAGFVNEEVSIGWNQATGFTWDPLDPDKMYVWEKAGKLWYIENGVRNVILDISEEVGDWGDYGLLSVALDPEFNSNGLIYLYYVVDRHHLLYFGTPNYVSTANELYNATIGRITRYQLSAATNFTTVVANSRTILLGESITTGIPILHTSHGVGTLLFGKDGTLLCSVGDGASFNGVDFGGAGPNTYAVQGLADGIITAQEDVGAFRSQMVNSLSGKILRLDPATGNGISSNPFFDANAPRAARSRVWALGLRNPSRMALKPNTGTHNPADAQPGTLLIGDVGWKTWEEMNIVTAPGQNFGWPVYEGMEINPEYDAMDTYSLEAPTPGGCAQPYYRFEQLIRDGGAGNPTFPDPCNPGQQINPAATRLFAHRKPTFDWNQVNVLARYSAGGTFNNVGSGSVPGPQFRGNASIGGAWYTGDVYPAEYQDTYFHGDYGQSWIRAFNFDANMEPDSVRDFFINQNNVGRFVFMAQHPTEEVMYYVRYTKTAGTNVEIRRLAYYPGNLPPVAVATSNVYFSASNSLTVNFNGSQSYDPEGSNLTYLWNFGDGSPTSNQQNPVKNFLAAPGVMTSYDVTLKVTDQQGLSNTVMLTIYLNNTPPVISATSIDAVTSYSIVNPTNLNLSATVNDAQTPLNQLDFSWQTVLHHNDHTHLEALDHNQTSATSLFPIGCDGPTYFYRIYLTVTDPGGLATTIYREIHPACFPLTEDDHVEYHLGQAVQIPVLANDFSEDGFNLNSFTIITPPTHGSVSYNAATGVVTYTQNGTEQYQDVFSYKISDPQGDQSDVAVVNLEWKGPPQLVIVSPTQGSKADNTFLPVRYAITGDTTLFHHLRVVVNNGVPADDYTMDRIHEIYNIAQGNYTVRMHLVKANNQILSYAVSSDTVNFDAIRVGNRAKLRMGVLTNLASGSSNWRTVTLDTTYTKMVVVATVQYNSPSDLPAVPRIRNASNGNTFQIQVQNPSGAALSGYKVHYIVAEEGAYTLAQDGIKMEAYRKTSNRTAHANQWASTRENRGSTNTYATPVVVGSIMTNNDAGWSVFWASSDQEEHAPNPTKVFAGKHVGEDANITRANESIGYMIFESGQSIVRGRPFTASLSPEGVIYGVDNSPNGFEYTVSGLRKPFVAVASQAGMGDYDGSWAVLMGANPFTAGGLRLALDEDQILDAERSHNTEQVGVLIVDSVITAPPVSFPVELVSFNAVPRNGVVELEWVTASELNSDVFVVERSQNGTQFEEILRQDAAGNSTRTLRYTDTDRSPLAGTSYYRLKEIDIDGTTFYSNVVEVTLGAAAFQVQPNPVRRDQTLRISLSTEYGEQIELSLTNLLGQTILTETHTASAAFTQASLHIDQVPAGTYLLRVRTRNGEWMEKVLLLN